MGKNIEEFSSDMYKVLSAYKLNLEEDVSYVLQHGTDQDFNKLSTTIYNLRNYLVICIDMIDKIPESKKIISALKSKITPIYNCVILEEKPNTCLNQAKATISLLSKIIK